MPRARSARSSKARTSPFRSTSTPVRSRQTDYEVSLVLEGGAGEGENTLFKFELHYAGVFRVENIPAEQIQPAIMIEGPRLLFPFARQIIADAVRNGGYPPLYIDPIDFQALFVQRLAGVADGRRATGEARRIALLQAARL